MVRENTKKIPVMIMMMMINCFCGMVDRRKAFSLISSRDHCQRSSPSRISDMPRAGFEPAQGLSSGLLEWSCAVVITTKPRRHKLLWMGFKNKENSARSYNYLKEVLDYIGELVPNGVKGEILEDWYKVLLKVACVINLKLVFTDYFFL